MKFCAYFGKVIERGEKEHVIPRNLYPLTETNSTIQRITVLSCKDCNHSWANDEAHFRNVLSCCGEPNIKRKALWDTKILRSFDKIDGDKRRRDLQELFKPIETKQGTRYMIYPAEDERVLRIIRKIIRGLSHYHKLETAIDDSRVWCDVLKYQVPDEFMKTMQFAHREEDIIKYQFTKLDYQDLSSGWLLTFYENIKFIGIVHKKVPI